jgi:hypothetical protein
MFDPLLGLGALAALLLAVPLADLVPLAPPVDPGPSERCPSDMRLVHGVHEDQVSHLCIDPRRGPKDTHCFGYWSDFTIAEGPSTKIDVCMDQFESPNVRGAKPFVMRSFEDAEKWCTQRSKRVCSEEEWELACEGGDYRPLAYGWAVNKSICNSDKGWKAFDAAKLYPTTTETSRRELERLWQGAPSGSYRACVSPFGVHDLMGNVEEWVSSRRGRRYPGVLRGGFWAKPWTGCRGANDAHEPSFRFYETGFRCCAEPLSVDERDQRNPRDPHEKSDNKARRP